MFHRQSVDAWISTQRNRSMDVTLKQHLCGASENMLHDTLKDSGANSLHVCDVVDDVLRKRLERAAAKLNIAIHWYASPAFMLDRDDVCKELESQKRFFMARFYQKQRRRHDILIEDDGPVGGKWSFDADNRKSLPRKIVVPQTELVSPAPAGAQQNWCQSNFPDAPGSTEEFWWPHTRDQALKILNEFLDLRFASYGDYQDAISSKHTFVFHAVISPFINAGLLTPDEVVSAALARSESGDIPFNALEGFIRQVIGWREYIRGVYELKGGFQRTRNFFEFDHSMPKSFIDGTTGIDPVDAVVERVNNYAWCHHIERLMILGNFTLLCEIDPDDVYRWFSSQFVDAYDWVMVPNVYGMSQYADGGLMCTKPYISGSNYVRKMSDFKKGEWCDVWDALYWRFIHTRKELFSSNPRMSMMLRMLEKMDADKKHAHLKLADEFLTKLHA